MKLKIISLLLLVMVISPNILLIATETNQADPFADASELSDGQEYDVDSINELMQNELDNMQQDSSSSNIGQITEIQDQIDSNREKMTEYKAEARETQKKIDKLEKKIPTYEKEAANSLKVAQKLYNQKSSLKFLVNLFKDKKALQYFTSSKSTEKIAAAIKDDTMKLFTSIEELKESKKELEHMLDSLEDLESELLKDLDVLASEEKVEIISRARQISEEFYASGCPYGGVYGLECGPELDEVDEFEIPIKSGYVTNEFGGWDALNQDDGHTGIDLTQDVGNKGYKEIYPSGPGQIVDVFVDSYGGIQVMMIHVKDGKNYITNYAHLASVNVEPGDIVSTDDQIGVMGDTGVATGLHVHFEIIQSAYYIHSKLENPRNYVDFPLTYLPF